MAPSKVGLEAQDRERDSAFNKAMHGNTAQAKGGFRAIMGKAGKGTDAQKAAVDEYFKHWDNKDAKDETEEDRAKRTAEYATLTRQYVAKIPSHTRIIRY